MTLTFEEIMNTPVDDLPVELQLPAGTWRLRCKAITPREDAILLTFEPVTACDDVDADELAAWEGTEEEEDVVIFHRLRGTPRATAAQLKTLCRLVGVDKPKELISSEFYATLTYDPNKKDPSRPWPRLRNFVRLNDGVGDDDL